MRRIVGWLAGIFVLAAAPLTAAPCVPSATSLCLSAQRFGVEVQWKDFQGHTGAKARLCS